MQSKIQKDLLEIYEALYKHFGPRNWWPAETRFEVVVGALLAQFVSWKNVQKAISNLKSKNMLNPTVILNAEDELVETLIKPTRFYKQKTRKLKEFCYVLKHKYKGSLDNLFRLDMSSLRKELLSIKGIGPETADSIMLYAAEKPVFVVDTYTKRIFQRLGYFESDIDYHSMQKFFAENLPEDVSLYNEYHALIDALGNGICKNKPLCIDCPLTRFCKNTNCKNK